MFDVEQFIADLRATLGERSRQATREVVARAMADPAAIVRALGAPEKPGAAVLHHAPDLTVLNVAWSPYQVTFPHNHLLSAVIGMYGGREDNMFWRRIAEPERHQIEAAGGAALGSGDAILLGHDIIHSVVNPLNKISTAIHVYDGDFFAVHRSMWDAESLVEQPYDMQKVSRGMLAAPVR